MSDTDTDPVEFLTLEDILAAGAVYLGERLQVRDYGILEAAVGRPQAVVFGESVYPDIHFKAAALLHSLVKGHALLDGNKRLGLASLRLFYALNKYTFTATDDEKYDLVIEVADDRLTAVEDIAARLEKFAHPS